MYNIQKAVSRLDYAPKLKDIKVTDIKKGVGVFTPKPDLPVSFARLKESLKKAGYTLAGANLQVVGRLEHEKDKWFLVATGSNQRFTLVGPQVEKKVKTFAAGEQVEIQGDWKTIGDKDNAAEEITVRTAPKPSSAKPVRAAFKIEQLDRFTPIRFVPASYNPDESVSEPPAEALSLKPAAPIRITSPGLTVYKGGAITPRLYLIKQHLGVLDVDRQVVDLSVSYTPSPRVQLEVEIPFSRTSFENNSTSGSGEGLGNITLWSKYRFFRKVKTYGDRQAAVRFGIELPTGKKDGPSAAQLNAPAFVRQQLTPINGGLSPHFDIAFSQAGGRFIFGGNAEAIVRSERDGFRLGHEVRVSTDSEYVLLPRKYDAPGGELFVILETTFVHRATGRVGGLAVGGSRSTEYFLAPGLQYAAAPRFVVEGSFQFPVIQNTGPLLLRTDRNLLLGVKYLF